MALMRAMARDTKILLLDEATSSVDDETDALIQRIIQNHLKGVTVSLMASFCILGCMQGNNGFS